jgi:hypothetical protein
LAVFGCLYKDHTTTTGNKKMKGKINIKLCRKATAPTSSNIN